MTLRAFGHRCLHLGSTPTPVGESCCHCGLTIEAADEGFTMPMVYGSGAVGLVAYHRHCLMLALGLDLIEDRTHRRTRQGVRDLGGNEPREPSVLPADCDHERMTTCCWPVNCGHWHCPDCGLAWDDGAGQ